MARKECEWCGHADCGCENGKDQWKPWRCDCPDIPADDDEEAAQALQEDENSRWAYFHKNGDPVIHKNEQRYGFGAIVCPECIEDREGRMEQMKYTAPPSKNAHYRNGGLWENLIDWDKRVIAVRNIRIHKPAPFGFGGEKGDMTECGRLLKSVISTELGIEKVTCQSCIRICDGV